MNKTVNGAKGSQHAKGEAADIVANVPTDNGRLFHYIKDNLPFDQLIWERGDELNPAWIHVSYKPAGGRREVLKTRDGKNYTRFS